jgi:nucleoside 2-deoxyribosyltransferase
VYLAGPEVFLPDAVALGDRKRAICQAHGFEASFPLDRLPEVEDRSPADIARQIFAICTDMMDGCDLLVANVTPFRGVSADVGTAIEVGYMLGRGKPVFAYSTVEAHYDRRVRDAAVAGAGELVEDFDLADNLMVEGAARWAPGLPAGAGAGVVRVGAAPGERWTDLRAFTRTVALARDHWDRDRARGEARHIG